MPICRWNSMPGRMPRWTGEKRWCAWQAGNQGAVFQHAAELLQSPLRDGLSLPETGSFLRRSHPGFPLFRWRAAADHLRQPEDRRLPGPGRQETPGTAGLQGVSQLLPVREPLLHAGSGARERRCGERHRLCPTQLLLAHPGGGHLRRVERLPAAGLSSRCPAANAGPKELVASVGSRERPSCCPCLPEIIQPARPGWSSPNGYLQVDYDTNRYSVPYDYRDKQLVLRAFPFRIELLYLDQVIASHVRCFERAGYPDPLHYLPLLQQRPGSI
jgi:hypothetical protein